MSEQIGTELDGGILRVEIRRPEKKNALTGPMYEALANALEAAECNPDVRVILIHGQSGAFTAGNDLSDFLANPPVSEEPLPPVFRFLNTFSTLTKPFMAAVSGVAVGVGNAAYIQEAAIRADCHAIGTNQSSDRADAGCLIFNGAITK